MRQLVRMWSFATGSWESLPARSQVPWGLVTWRPRLPVQWRLPARLRLRWARLLSLRRAILDRIRREGGVSADQGILLFGLLVVLVAVL